MLGPIKRFTIDSAAAGNRSQTWEDYLKDVYYAHHVKTPNGQPMVGYIEKRLVADLGVSRHRASAHSIHRTAELIKADKVEQHAFVIPTSGRFECKQRNNSISVAPRSLYVLNASEPFEVGSTDGSATLAITLPSELCRLALRSIDEKCCVAGIGEPLLIAAMTTLLSEIMDRDTNVDAVWLRNVLCGLIDAMLNPRYASNVRRSWSMSDSARSFIIDSGRREIANNLHKQTFSVLDAANACGVSVRYLQNVFQGCGTTFSEQLLRARLSRAAALLRAPEHKFKRVGQIAKECGFASQAHFATRYKTHFGHKPTDERS